MSNTALGVAQSSEGVGTTDTAMRHILGAQWASTGVVDGLAVTGGTTLAYEVASGVAVCSKGASDGKTLAWFAGGSTPTVAANNSGNPRIDCVWITSHDLTQGDADNLVTLGVTQGTPAATPTAPTIPTYATLLAQMRMPAGATTTANATQAASIGYAIPYGASLGMLAESVNTMDGTGDGMLNKYYVEQATNFYIPTDRLITFKFYVCASASDRNYSDWFQSFMLDGTEIANSGGEFHFTSGWSTQMHEFSTTVQAGNHTAAVRSGLRGGAAPQFHYAGDQYTSFLGRRLQIWDGGVAR